MEVHRELVIALGANMKLIRFLRVPNRRGQIHRQVRQAAKNPGADNVENDALMIGTHAEIVDMYWTGTKMKDSR